MTKEIYLFWWSTVVLSSGIGYLPTIFHSHWARVDKRLRPIFRPTIWRYRAHNAMFHKPILIFESLQYPTNRWRRDFFVVVMFIPCYLQNPRNRKLRRSIYLAQRAWTMTSLTIIGGECLLWECLIHALGSYSNGFSLLLLLWIRAVIDMSTAWRCWLFNNISKWSHMKGDTALFDGVSFGHAAIIHTTLEILFMLWISPYQCLQYSTWRRGLFHNISIGTSLE